MWGPQCGLEAEAWKQHLSPGYFGSVLGRAWQQPEACLDISSKGAPKECITRPPLDPTRGPRAVSAAV